MQNGSQPEPRLPNYWVDEVGIYTRLWCVYEAYLGTQYKKTCIMPARPMHGWGMCLKTCVASMCLSEKLY